MKKSVYLLLILTSITSVGLAQIGISKGLIGGLNLATVGGDNAPSGVKSVSGYAAGVYLELNIPGPFSLEANALYSMKGAKWEAGTVTYTDTYGYVDVPILLKYTFPLPAVSPCVYAGPMFGTLLSAKEKREGGLSPGESDIKDEMPKSDVGAVVGVGIGFSLLRIDARYALGLSTLDKTGIGKKYNRVISLYVGLSL